MNIAKPQNSLDLNLSDFVPKFRDSLPYRILTGSAFASKVT